jgi:hypothetical protein
MPNRSPDELFQLIRTLEKAEKRNFKLFMSRSAATDGSKTLQLFDALDGMDAYDEALLLRRNRGISKQQLSNLKSSLQRQLLTSLRVLRDEDNIDIRLHEQLDHARILYNKGLHQQSLKALARAKELARSHHQLTYWLQALILEKKIESLHITRSFDDRAGELSREVDELDARILMIGRLSNLALRLYGWYIQRGQVRDRSEGEDLRQFFHDNMPQDAAGRPGFYERLYLHQCHAWYGFIAQDLLLYYRSCRRWVDLFSEEPHMRKVEAQQYIKGMHNLLNAHFTLGNPAGFLESLRQFEDFSRSPEACMSLNNRVQTFVYLHLARINRHYMEGTFREGLLLVPEIEEGLEAYAMQIDRHRELVFYYKIACLYFGCGELGEAIRYLRRIIDGKADLRADIQCYARLLHLIAHYEDGNFDILESLIKSVYRFMSRMQNLSAVEREILSFLQRTFHKDPRRIEPDLRALREKLLPLERDPHARRSFMYLDFVSWLDSAILGVPVQDVIRERYLRGPRFSGGSGRRRADHGTSDAE